MFLIPLSLQALYMRLYCPLSHVHIASPKPLDFAINLCDDEIKHMTLYLNPSAYIRICKYQHTHIMICILLRVDVGRMEVCVRTGDMQRRYVGMYKNSQISVRLEV